MKNYGFISNNSQVKIGSLAIGKGATVNAHGNTESEKERDEIIQKIDECVELIRENENSLENVGELLDSISIIKAEIESKSPNKTTVKGVINELASSVASVASLAVAVGTLKSAIMAII